MLDDTFLESNRTEAMVRLLESVSSVRRRYQFFVWLQNHLQSLLPHQIAVCGAYQRSRREMVFEVFNSVVLTPQAQGLLSEARGEVQRTAMTQWVRSRGQPVTLRLSSLQGECSPQSVPGWQSLMALGVDEMLAHGVSRPQRPAELESFFMLATPHRPVLPTSLAHIDMLMPYLHSTYLRVQATEMEIGEVSQRGGVPASNAPPTSLTDRERQVLSHVREGLSNQQIGEAMGISPLTVKNHVQKLLRKLGAANRAQAVAKTSSPGPQGGFTLLELLVVMVIIGLLAGYVGPKVFANIGKSEVKVARAQIDALQKALDQYRIDNGRYPSTQQGLQALVNKPADEARWGGPYLGKAVPRDPWRNEYQYRQPGEHGDYDLLSLGRDGRPGGQGEDADLVSW